MGVDSRTDGGALVVVLFVIIFIGLLLAISRVAAWTSVANSSKVNLSRAPLPSAPIDVPDTVPAEWVESFGTDIE